MTFNRDYPPENADDVAEKNKIDDDDDDYRHSQDPAALSEK
jgi:hypothetical protein